jgi:predicted DNA-binding transcriptional regulator AlpA
MQVVQGGTKRPKAAATYCGFGTTKLWELVRQDPSFPQPIRLAGRVTLFYVTQLDEWLARKAQENQPQRAPRPKTVRHSAVAHQG